MKTFTITRKQVVNAIQSLPIGSKDGYSTSKPFAKGTKLTPVGAILRSLSESHKSAKVIYDLTRDGFNSVAAYNVNSVEALAKLDSEYASLRNTTMRTPKIRNILESFVNDVFPAKIQVSLWNPADEAVATEAQVAA